MAIPYKIRSIRTSDDLVRRLPLLPDECILNELRPVRPIKVEDAAYLLGMWSEECPVHIASHGFDRRRSWRIGGGVIHRAGQRNVDFVQALKRLNGALPST